jgi:DNA-binding transcriptional LysR family regulator
VLIELAQTHPLLHIHTSYSDRFVDLVAEGFDCAVRIGYMPDSALNARRVGPVRGKILASPDYVARHGAPETLEALGDHEALIQGTETWRLLDGDHPVTFHPRGRFKADSGIALTAAAVAGLGIAALPDFLTEERLADGSLVAVMTRYRLAEAGMYVVRSPSPHPSRKVRALTELLLQRFQDNHGRG